MDLPLQLLFQSSMDYLCANKTLMLQDGYLLYWPSMDSVGYQVNSNRYPQDGEKHTNIRRKQNRNQPQIRTTMLTICCHSLRPRYLSHQLPHPRPPLHLLFALNMLGLLQVNTNLCCSHFVPGYQRSWGALLTNTWRLWINWNRNGVKRIHTSSGIQQQHRNLYSSVGEWWIYSQELFYLLCIYYWMESSDGLFSLYPWMAEFESRSIA